MLPLPGYDELGRKVFLYRMGCFPPDKVKVEDLEKASGMVAEVLAYEEPLIFVTGVVVVVDLEGYTLNHLTHRPLGFMKKQAKYFQVSLKLRSSLPLLLLIKCLMLLTGCRTRQSQEY